MQPRLPNHQERHALITWLTSQHLSTEATQEELNNVNHLIERAFITLFDDYLADSPGYAGKLLMVVWPAGPAMYEVFIWRNGQIERVPQDDTLTRL